MPGKMHLILIAAGAAVALGADLLSAVAEPVPPSAAGPETHGPDGRGPGGHPPSPVDFLCKDLDAHQAGMLAFAEVKLAITPAQKPLWTQFAEKATAANAPIRQVCGEISGKPEPKTLPERLEVMDKIETARLAQLHQFREAVDVVYAQLTPEQRETADHVLDRHGPGPNGPGMGPGPGGHPPFDVPPPVPLHP